MTVIQGENLYIRDNEESDYPIEAAFQGNKELDALDPPVGVCNNPMTYSIVLNNGILIGICSMYNYTGSQAEFGIRIWDRNYWGLGYGSEVTNLLCDWAFRQLYADVILLKTPVTNLRAIRCYIKCGFEPYLVCDVCGINMVWMKKFKNHSEEE